MTVVNLGAVIESLAGFRKKPFILIVNQIVYQHLVFFSVLGKQQCFSKAHWACSTLRAVLPLGLRPGSSLPRQSGFFAVCLVNPNSQQMLDDGVYNRWEKLTKGHLYAVISRHSSFEFQDNLQYPFFFYLLFSFFSIQWKRFLKPFRKMAFLNKILWCISKSPRGS